MEDESQINDVEKTDKKSNSSGVGDEGDASGTHNTSQCARSAPMPVERNALYYNMNHKHRGIAIIFNHEKFNIPSLDPRRGTNVDSKNLAEVLKGLGFCVTILNDPPFGEILSCIRKTANKDHSDFDCLLIAVMTHGELGMLYAKDIYYKPETLWLQFTADKCPTLAGKPKIFLIQACQGDQGDTGVTLYRTAPDGPSTASYRIPIHADFLIVYSTVPGYLSWRDVFSGSWFIEALCDQLQSYSHSETKQDILNLLTTVCRKVALDYESNNPDILFMHQQKQIPCITSMLTRLLVFDKK